MDSQGGTRQQLGQAIKEEMEQTSLDKITVTRIVERAGVTRQTFYRNFKDKYDLVNWHFEQLAQRSFKQMGVSLTLREGLIRKFQFLKGEKTFFTQAFRSNDCNSVVAYDYQCILEFYGGILEKEAEMPGIAGRRGISPANVLRRVHPDDGGVGHRRDGAAHSRAGGSSD